MEPLLVTVKEGFRAIGISSSKGYELLAAGELEAVKIGRATRIPTDSLRAFVERLRASEAN